MGISAEIQFDYKNWGQILEGSEADQNIGLKKRIWSNFHDPMKCQYVNYLKFKMKPKK